MQVVGALLRCRSGFLWPVTGLHDLGGLLPYTFAFLGFSQEWGRRRRGEWWREHAGVLSGDAHFDAALEAVAPVQGTARRLVLQKEGVYKAQGSLARTNVQFLGAPCADGTELLKQRGVF